MIVEILGTAKNWPTPPDTKVSIDACNNQLVQDLVLQPGEPTVSSIVQCNLHSAVIQGLSYNLVCDGQTK